MTDPIADLLTRVRNAQMARHTSVSVPHSKLKEQILHVLEKKGFVGKVKKDLTGKFPNLVIELDPLQKLSLKRVSKPGQRNYVTKDEITKVLNGYGVALISTSKGVLTGEEARKAGIGGELLCEVF